MMTNNEVIKECRQAAREAGLTFKVDHYARVNRQTAYEFTQRDSGTVVLTNCTLNMAYDNVCSGYISSWNGTKFEGVNQFLTQLP